MFDQAEPKHDIHTTTLPCCSRSVRLYVRAEKAIHLHERTCKDCGEIWTLASDRERIENGWATSYFLKRGRPTVPAVTEVLDGREDGWINDDTFERHQRRDELKRR